MKLIAKAHQWTILKVSCDKCKAETVVAWFNSPEGKFLTAKEAIKEYKKLLKSKSKIQ